VICKNSERWIENGGIENPKINDVKFFTKSLGHILGGVV
jgi:hypothetical protein